MSELDIKNAVHPGLARRLAAIFYDAWLIFALWLLGVTVDFFIRRALGLDTDGAHLLLQLYLLGVPFIFFGWFWTHGGQTLGMRAWRLRLVDERGAGVGWRAAAIRVAGAYLSALAAGLGYLWMLVDRDHRTWHDRLSHTRLVMISKD
jgi:uncharacterized RDD family membrane protein YckC